MLFLPLPCILIAYVCLHSYVNYPCGAGSGTVELLFGAGLVPRSEFVSPCVILRGRIGNAWDIPCVRHFHSFVLHLLCSGGFDFAPHTHRAEGLCWFLSVSRDTWNCFFDIVWHQILIRPQAEMYKNEQLCD